jgi:hypothetical protein
MKIHESLRNVVALCDNNILGKKFFEGKRQLDVRENFYKGEEIKEEKLIELLKIFRSDDAIVVEDNIGKVDGIPFALVLL